MSQSSGALPIGPCAQPIGGREDDFGSRLAEPSLGFNISAEPWMALPSNVNTPSWIGDPRGVTGLPAKCPGAGLSISGVEGAATGANPCGRSV